MNTVDDALPAATNHLRRRAKCQIPTTKIERPPTAQPVTVTNVTNKAMAEKLLQKERLERALSIQKQAGQGQKMKRVVFNGTFPIDDPFSSRFEVDEEGGIYDDEFDYDEYNDSEDPDAEDPSDYDGDPEDGEY